jgi:hypothetical protein
MTGNKTTAKELSPLRELFRPMGKKSAQKLDMVINLKDLEPISPAKSFDLSEAGDGVGDLEDPDEQERKRFSDLLRVRRQTSILS